ncbi:hypothetical protein SAY86_018874 [Trapa natans]|uniref:Choline/ethanolaminephosphotransferase 1 n=1 Tax=Trapa natans TaxID=22666 RepID=A0AAN7LP00_TRANT|nr:hypothetical protein SAY86_018874 [Trapa natans]
MHLHVRYVPYFCNLIVYSKTIPGDLILLLVQCEALAFGSTAMCGRTTFWFWVISAVTFYGATWEHYFTNTLILPAINGPTEGLMLIYMGHFFTCFVGAEWWAQSFGHSIPLLGWVPILNGFPTYEVVLLLMTVFGVIPTVSSNVSNVHKVVQARRGSMLLAMAMLCPFFVLLVGILAWDHLSTINLIASHPHMVIMGSGLAFGFLVGRMILSHLCEEPKGLKTNMCMSLIYLPLAIANALTAQLNDGVPLVDEFWVLLGYFAFTVMLYLHFATSVIQEITTALGIYCFRTHHCRCDKISISKFKNVAAPVFSQCSVEEGSAGEIYKSNTLFYCFKGTSRVSTDKNPQQPDSEAATDQKHSIKDR